MEQENVQKRDKKAILSIVLVIVLLIILVVAGIIAYLTDTETAENKFKIGNVDIELYEGDWNEINAQGVTANAEIVKEPQVKNVGINEAYVYLKVKIPKVRLKEKDENTSPLFTYQVDSGWTELDERTVDEDRYIEKVYYYNKNDGRLATGETTSALFEKVKIANITSETKYSNEDETGEYIKQKIDIIAYAIQVDNLPEGKDTVQTAYNMYLEQK